MFSSKVVEGCFGKVHLSNYLRWQSSPETSEAESLDEASVPEKEIQWPNRPGGKRINIALIMLLSF